MNNLLWIIVVLVVWFLLQAVILPKFGVQTWLVKTRQETGEKIKAAEDKTSAPVIKWTAANFIGGFMHEYRHPMILLFLDRSDHYTLEGCMIEKTPYAFLQDEPQFRVKV